jgi:hypothetical protein
MIFESPSRLSSSQVPQSKSLVPRSGEGKVTVGRQNDIGDEVGMSIQSLDGNAEVGIVAGQLPHDQSFI